jgi:hypothetical protein
VTTGFNVADVELVLRVQNAACFVVDLAACFEKCDSGNNSRFIGTVVTVSSTLTLTNYDWFVEYEEGPRIWRFGSHPEA